MNRNDASTADDRVLRDTLTQQAPRPSAAHNEAVMAAAKSKAARLRRANMIARNRTWSGIGLAAAILLTIGVWQAVPDRHGDVDNVRNGVPSSTVPADNATLAVAPSEFHWTAVRGASRYKVKVFDEAATLIVESAWTDRNSLSLQAGSSDVIVPGATYFWTVELDGGGPRKLLGPYWFSVE